MDHLGQGRVAFLGPQGTFSHAAVLAVFGEGALLLECPSIDDVFAAVEAGRALHGVVPVENSTEGAVNNTLDCLVESRLKIVGEVVVPIVHNLLIRPGADATAIARVCSHKQSLAQCRKWLAHNLSGIPTEECASNARAALRAAQEDGTAAIAGDMAAAAYGLQVVARGIQDQQNNSTRFIVVGKQPRRPTGRDKTSTLVYTENRPGSLFRVLEPFERHQVSLTRIETRPSRKEIWDYVFFIDFEGHVEDAPVAQVLKELALRTVEVKLLGSYPMAAPPGPQAPAS